ncbi:Trypsin T2a [Operophtera brumata]|uniref:Trypsin T2a n=1 Tax=Operophtera brumata TaxID=104452 RepID=A0A0L7KRS8_OPEBR|nr:Trypsin T2a [Operophtera brumata]
MSMYVHSNYWLLQSIVKIFMNSLFRYSAIPIYPQTISGGSATYIEKYPHVASLSYSWKSITFWQTCAGVILNTRAILTAAHCPAGDAIDKWRVSLGSSFANSGSIVHVVATIVIHPNYNSMTNDNDIGIIRTSIRIDHTDFVKPASIAGADIKLADKEVVWAVGWGYTSAVGYPSEQLRHEQIRVINQAVCIDSATLPSANSSPTICCAPATSTSAAMTSARVTPAALSTKATSSSVSAPGVVDVLITPSLEFTLVFLATLLESRLTLKQYHL